MPMINAYLPWTKLMSTSGGHFSPQKPREWGGALHPWVPSTALGRQKMASPIPHSCQHAVLLAPPLALWDAIAPAHSGADFLLPLNSQLCEPCPLTSELVVGIFFVWGLNFSFPVVFKLKSFLCLFSAFGLAWGRYPLFLLGSVDLMSAFDQCGLPEKEVFRYWAPCLPSLGLLHKHSSAPHDPVSSGCTTIGPWK